MCCDDRSDVLSVDKTTRSGLRKFWVTKKNYLWSHFCKKLQKKVACVFHAGQCTQFVVIRTYCLRKPHHPILITTPPPVGDNATTGWTRNQSRIMPRPESDGGTIQANRICWGFFETLPYCRRRCVLRLHFFCFSFLVLRCCSWLRNQYVGGEPTPKNSFKKTVPHLL